MRVNREVFIWLLGALLLSFGCSGDDDMGIDPISSISVKLNGAELVDGSSDLPVLAELEIVFSAALDPALFEAAFSLTTAGGNPPATFSYANQSSKVTIGLNLAFQTTYTLRVTTSPIGRNNEQLTNELLLVFTTMEDGTISSLPACTTASSSCLRTASFTGDGTADFQFYASFPLYEEMARWENITAAIIVVHGVNRNADDYFNYLMGALQTSGLEENVLLIAPFFKNESEASANEFFWTNTGWREGRNTISNAEISSFAVVDQLITQLGDSNHFPVLENVIVTGHSSGGLFTHLYAAANPLEDNFPNLEFDYVVANSQYFYYPDGRRVNDDTNQLYTPTDCAGYDIWPLGYNVLPPYLAATTMADYNDRFVSRELTYFLGNGMDADPSLNTTSCNATLLGPTRFARGEQMFRYLELAYPGQGVHQRAIVEGIGHDGSGMYGSPKFRQLLANLISE